METSVSAIPGGLCAARGFQAAGVAAGIKPGSTKLDLMLLVSDVPCSAAAVYTQNKVKGAPLAVTKQHLQNGCAQAIICNSGNANTCAPGGEDFARWTAKLAADSRGIAANDVIVASTGVIGQQLARAPFEKGIPQLAKKLRYADGSEAAQAMMTTDTVSKEIAYAFTIGGVSCHIGGACKGSGMINPNMATMLAFITTDAAIAPAMLQKALDETIATTLNQINVDGDTSTNDMAAILANGTAGNAEITAEGDDYATFANALHAVLKWMSRALAADGEGATKLLECTVAGAGDDATARKIAKTILSSNLFKAAMFGADANWGRVLCAIGYTPGNFSVDNITVSLSSAAGEVTVCRHSTHQPYSEEQAALILAEKEICIHVDMNSGTGCGMAWGCDLTYDYVKINGDYRS